MFRLLSYQESWKDVYTSRTASAELAAATHKGSDQAVKSVCEIVLAKEPETPGKRSRLLTVLAVAEPSWVGPFVAAYLTTRVNREIDALVFQDRSNETSPEEKIREACQLLDGMLASSSTAPVKKTQSSMSQWLCCLCAAVCLGILAWVAFWKKPSALPSTAHNLPASTNAQNKIIERLEADVKRALADYTPIQGESISLNADQSSYTLNLTNKTDARQVLVYCQVGSGGALQPDQGYLEVSSLSAEGKEYKQKLYISTWTNQETMSFNSDYFWLPWPKSGKVKVGFTGFNHELSRNLSAKVEIVGWR